MLAIGADSKGPDEAGPALGTVMVYTVDRDRYGATHERASRTEIAHRLAVLKKLEFAGEYGDAPRRPGPTYFVPSDTLPASVAEKLGVRTQDDLFGGVVPYPFVATKVITHPLLEPGAVACPGWSQEFSATTSGSVLLGYSVFSLEDARRAGRRMLKRGPARMKPVRATGGLGQLVAANAAELDEALESLDRSEIATHGLVLEENLEDVTTYSVGQVRVGDLVATYSGRQRLTRNNAGLEVYGGSDLFVARGGFAALLGFSLSEPARRAVAQARAYHAAAVACYGGLFASRANYDVARGTNGLGQSRSGVLEQSWRLGGASSAEVAALEAFRRDPALPSVRASSVEVYGSADLPADATLYFSGVDERVGRITKYSLVEHDEHAG